MKRVLFFIPVVLLGVLFLAVVPNKKIVAQDHSHESEACLDCHDDAAAQLMGTPHTVKVGDQWTKVACVSCHEFDERHYDDPETYPMTNPVNLDPRAAAQVCSGCHVESHVQNMKEQNVHAENQINCTSCHKLHGNNHARLLKDDEAKLCTGCHEDVKGTFALPFRHPVEDGVVKCSDCHMTLDLATRHDTYAGSSEACFKCHDEFRGPFPYEHEATLDFSTEEGGCLNCHAAHGSHEPRMLKQSYESPNFALCAQCHVVPKHQSNSNHGTMWAGRACDECHVDIHGSYVSRNFLSPALRAQGCFNSGCHEF